MKRYSIKTVIFAFMGIILFTSAFILTAVSDHPFFDFYKDSHFSIESMRIKIGNVYYTPAFFPAYLYIEKREIQKEKFEDFLKSSSGKTNAVSNSNQESERYFPVDIFLISLTFIISSAHHLNSQIFNKLSLDSNGRGPRDDI